MSYHPGCCYYPVGFDYSLDGVQRIPVGTVRKFGGTWHDGRFGYIEGERIKSLQDAGKRVLGTYDIADHAQWNTMPDADWRGYVERFVVDCPTLKIVEVGNEPGKSMIPGYFSKLKIASEVLRASGVWVLMGAPYPGAEGAFWDAANARGAWGWVDGVCCHPYRKTAADSLAAVKSFRNKLNAVGAPGKHIHLTEFGWPTAGPSTNPFVVTEAIQANYVTQAFANWRVNSGALLLNNCLLYTYNDGYGPDYGVVRTDGSRKPAYDSLARAVQ